MRVESRAIRLRLLPIAIVAIAIRVPMLPSAGYVKDQREFIYWGIVAAVKGLPAVYDWSGDGGRRISNYPPGYLYILRAIAPIFPAIAGPNIDASFDRALAGGEETPASRVAFALFKSPAALADVLTAVLLCVFLSRRMSGAMPFAVGLVYACHPVVLHNSVIWGQVDALHTLMLLLSVEAAARRRPVLLTLAATAAVLFKAQSIILAPLWLMALISPEMPRPQMLKSTTGHVKATAARLLACIGAAVTMFGLVILPFGRNLQGVWDAYFRAVGYFPYVQLNAFSAWFLTNPIDAVGLSFDPYHRDDVAWVMGISPKVIGLTAVLASWMVFLVISWRRKTLEEMIRWGARLLPLTFFVLPTQMHERYLFPAVALWAWTLDARRSGWIGWIIVGLCAWLNSVWVFAGAPGGVMEAWFGESLHTPGVGAGVGVACAAALIVVWFHAMWDGIRPLAKEPVRASA